MTELESLDRERRATDRRIRHTKFPVVKTLHSFDFLAMPSVNKTLVPSGPSRQLLRSIRAEVWAMSGIEIKKTEITSEISHHFLAGLVALGGERKSLLHC